MRSNKIKGASEVEYFIKIILFISFLILGLAIASSVFHFSLLPSGVISSGNGTPSPCIVNVTNISTTANPNTFKVSVYEGTPGLLYKVYMNNVNGADPSEVEPVGNYSVGVNSFSKTVKILDTTINTIVLGNTSGSKVSIDGIVYTAGGTCESEIFST